MINSQTVISIRRDKVDELRKISRSNPGFFKSFLKFYSISNYPLYLNDAIFVSHSEMSNITTCHVITPFLGSSLTNVFHKVFKPLDNGKIEWFDNKTIVDNLIMGFKGVFDVEDPSKLEIDAEFATAKNSVYSVFGFLDKHFSDITDADFECILDLTDFVEKDKNKELKMIKSLHSSISYMGSFAQRQVCLAFQANGLFKSYPFKSNKNINFDLNEIKKDFEAEAYLLNKRLEFVNDFQKQEILMKYVSSYEFQTHLANRLFSAFISGLKGKANYIVESK